MPRPFSPKVVTANHLLEGDVIYLTADDRWTRQLHAAEVLTDEADAQMRLLFAAAQSDAVVGAYLADVVLQPDGPRPAHLRDIVRQAGPCKSAQGKPELPQDV